MLIVALNSFEEPVVLPEILAQDASICLLGFFLITKILATALPLTTNSKIIILARGLFTLSLQIFAANIWLGQTQHCLVKKFSLGRAVWFFSADSK